MLILVCQKIWLEKNTYEQWCYRDIKLNCNHLIIEKSREYMAVYKIKKWWKKILYSPNTTIGKKFINKMYDENFA